MQHQQLGSGRAEVKIIFQQREKEFLLQKKDFFDKLENNRDFTKNSLLTNNTIISRQRRKNLTKKSLKSLKSLISLEILEISQKKPLKSLKSLISLEILKISQKNP